MGPRGKGEDMAWKVLWKVGDITWEKKGQFVYGCQSVWLAYNKKKGIPITISRVSTPETPPTLRNDMANLGNSLGLL